MNAPSYNPQQLRQVANEIIANVRELAAAGLTPAPTSNIYPPRDASHPAITVSGRDKGRLTEDDIMVIDFDGRAVGSDRQPSAETLLHTQLYRRFPEIGCVLHTHSLAQTVASRLFAGAGHVALEGYELLKAFAGNTTHDMRIDLPVLSNSQDMHTLAAQVDALLDGPCRWGYLIDGHGLYTWGADMAQARRHLDAFEFLLNCELELRKLK
jgi:methylthioribulose-1-phosphate dehydratase